MPNRRQELLEKERQNMDLAARLTSQLKSGSYECMICYDLVRPKDQIWSCAKSCFAVFHAKCIREWASTSASTSNVNLMERPEWRCPGCQFKYAEAPYPSCFCGKTDHPSNSRALNAVPHSCGDQCLKQRNCTHKCTAVCHPGPCEKCELMAPEMECYCGKVVLKFRCADVEESMDLSCNQTCGKLLSCGKHTCPNPCHDSACAPCPEQISVDCVCGKCTTDVPCDYDINKEVFQCAEVCGVEFPCGVHTCKEVCHTHVDGEVCATDPKRIETCPCGAESVTELLGGKQRMSCTEEIPVCENTCAKSLKCGHICISQCHTGECPPCSYKVSLPCRCGKSSSSLLCGEIALNEEGTYQVHLCDRVCTMKRSCKRHVCGNVCCPQDIAAHYCELQCGKTLKCGSHQCQMACGHTEKCHDCFEGVSFDELTCTCGSSVMYPPIPCGAAPPACNRPCRLPLACGHVSYSTHSCHPRSEPCPKCMIFVDRQCACGKTTMKNIPCSRVGSPSCGSPCLKPVEGCSHPCRRACHPGDCIDATNKCLEKCQRIRPICGHICTYPCHRKDFCTEDKPCKQLVRETCVCGHKTAEFSCGAWKDHAGRTGLPLPCDDACAVAKRNRSLAEALEIDTSNDISNAEILTTLATPAATLPTNLLEPLETQLHLLKYAYQNLIWTRTVEKVLSDFVLDATKKSYNYMCTKPAGIRFLVGIAPYYGLEGEVVDAGWGAAKTSVILRKKIRGGVFMGGVPTVVISSIAPQYQSIAAAAKAAQLAPAPVAGDAKEDESGENKVEDGDEKEDTVEQSEEVETSPGIAAPFDPSAPVSTIKTAVNGYKITNLNGALEDSDLRTLLEPILLHPVAITWLINDESVEGDESNQSNDCVVQLQEGGVDMSQVEFLLAQYADTLFDKVVMQGHADDLELCWLNSKNKVTSVVEIRKKKGKNKTFKAMEKAAPVALGTKSKYALLMDD
ncbi:FKBP12-associated protein [Rhizoclosmatium sp. JEL0117]|nr:FKBP12-associated protein [Rhizoclosmatium sp. JEL0117]